MSNFLRATIPLQILFLSISAWSNPIVIDLKEADAIKSSENLSIEVSKQNSRIVGDFTYRKIPNLSKEKKQYIPEYFRIIVPTYRAISSNRTNDSHANDPKLTVEAMGKRYETTEFHVVDREMARATLKKNPTLDWGVPRGYEFALYITQIPIEVLENEIKIRIEYVQEHIKERGKEYLLYTPFFENHRIWNAIGKNHADFLISISTDDSVELVIKSTGNEFGYMGLYDGKHLVSPEHLKPIKLRIITKS